MKWPLMRSALIAYWDRHRCRDGIPPWGRIDPVDIPRLLPYVGLIDVLEDGRQFRIRLAGEHIVAMHGASPVGMVIGDCGQKGCGCSAAPAALSAFRDALTHRKVASFVTEYANTDGDQISLSAVVMPLSTIDAEVGMLFGGALLHRIRRK